MFISVFVAGFDIYSMYKIIFLKIFYFILYLYYLYFLFENIFLVGWIVLSSSKHKKKSVLSFLSDVFSAETKSSPEHSVTTII